MGRRYFTTNNKGITITVRVFSSMDRMPCFELGDVGSIPARPANKALNTVSDNSRKGVHNGCSSTRYLGSSPAVDLK